MEEIKIELPLKIEYLHMLREFARNVCTFIAETKKVTHLNDDIELSMSEACTNAIKYGNSREGGLLKVSFQIFNDRLLINIKEQGKGFNLDLISMPNFERRLEGGYGIYIIKSKMDSISYSTEGQWNTLSMTKFFKEKGSQK